METFEFKHILVPVDFGESSGKALEVGVALAKRSGAALTLAHFWEVPEYSYLGGINAAPEFTNYVAQAAEELVDTTLRTVRAGVPEAKSMCRPGSPWRETLSAIEELNADLVVMGTHGRRGITHFLLGSVAEKVVRLSPVPVLVVPGRAAKERK